MNACFSSALLRLESVSLWGNCLTGEQISQLLLAITETSQLRLRKLNISGNDVSRVEADLLARSVVRLEDIFLLNTRLTSQQTELLLARIVSPSLQSGQSPLRALYIGDNSLASVSASVLARAVVRLQTVSLDDTNLRSEQVTALLRFISQSEECKLRNLDMLGMGVDINLLPLPAEIGEQLRVKFKVIDGCRLESI